MGYLAKIIGLSWIMPFNLSLKEKYYTMISLDNGLFPSWIKVELLCD
jgi:hypothetical protein